ncbi:MAG: DUF4255 domain-containing protein [bacterium]|nr:DUF4255 domain-containing protein [bacterium]
MSASTAIGEVSESLRNLLLEEITINRTKVTVLAPDEPGGGNRHVNLFLYKIVESPVLKNMDWQVKPGEPGTLIPPPLALNLYYLMTAYNKNDSETGNAPDHAVLGDAMRVFHENPVIPEQYLTDGLKNSREEIRIILNTLDLDELSKVWATFKKSFRLSVLYEVSVVQLDMLSDHEKAMAKRVETVGIPRISAPYILPVLDRIDPISGPDDSVLTVYGKHLTGWTPTVTIGGIPVPDVEPPTGDGFQITLPGNLLQGFYELQVDISNLSRQTFYFEVTG